MSYEERNWEHHRTILAEMRQGGYGYRKLWLYWCRHQLSRYAPYTFRTWVRGQGAEYPGMMVIDDHGLLYAFLCDLHESERYRLRSILWLLCNGRRLFGQSFTPVPAEAVAEPDYDDLPVDLVGLVWRVEQQEWQEEQEKGRR